MARTSRLNGSNWHISKTLYDQRMSPTKRESVEHGVVDDCEFKTFRNLKVANSNNAIIDPLDTNIGGVILW